MFWLFAVIALGYCLYRFFILHLIETWGSFGAIEWLMLAVAILMIPAMAYCAWRAVKYYRSVKAKQAEELKKYQEENARRKQRMYLEGDDELPPPAAEVEDVDDWEPGDGVEDGPVEEDTDPLEEEDNWEPGDGLEENVLDEGDSK